MSLKRKIPLLLFSLLLIQIFIKNLFHGYNKTSWNITEYLINYQGGFVRRGLIGELILQFHSLFNIQPYFFIITLSILCLAIYILFFLKHFKKAEIDPTIFLSILLLANPIVNDFWVRKDILLLLLFILIIKSINYKKHAWIFVNIFLIIGLLIHESIAFYTVPMLFIILFFKNQTKNSAFKTMLTSIGFLIPSLIALFLVVINHGDLIVSNKIWSSWQLIHFPFDNNSETATGAVQSLSLSLENEFYFFKSVLYNFNDHIYAPLAWLIIIGVVYLIMANLANFSLTKNSLRKNEMIKGFVFYSTIQLVSIIPLFILGWDFSRWIFAWTSTTFILFFINPISNHVISKYYDTFFKKFNFYKIKLSKNTAIILLLFLGLPFSSWDLLSYVKTTSIYLILAQVSEAIRSIGHLF